MATAALERLEREINGETVAAARTSLLARPLVDAAVDRWQTQAVMAGSSLALRWHGGEARIDGDRCALAQALDNLIVNAIEHGGSDVLVEAETCPGRFRVSVGDRGRGSDRDPRRELRAGPIDRLRGRRRHGHGLRVVRRTAAAHGGDFRLRCFDRGAVAILELPLSGEPA